MQTIAIHLEPIGKRTLQQLRHPQPHISWTIHMWERDSPYSNVLPHIFTYVTTHVSIARLDTTVNGKYTRTSLYCISYIYIYEYYTYVSLRMAVLRTDWFYIFFHCLPYEVKKKKKKKQKRPNVRRSRVTVNVYNIYINIEH